VIVKGDVSIACAPADVFDVLADPSTWFDLDPALEDVEPGAPLSPGVVGTMRHRRGPRMHVTTGWENTSLLPPSRLENLIRGPGYELRETVTLAPDVRGTRVAVVDTLTPTSLIGRVMVALSRGIIERDLRSRCDRLKSLIEVAGTRGARRT
jgi:hypothetical protein